MNGDIQWKAVNPLHLLHHLILLQNLPLLPHLEVLLPLLLILHPLAFVPFSSLTDYLLKEDMLFDIQEFPPNRFQVSKFSFLRTGEGPRESIMQISPPTEAAIM